LPLSHWDLSVLTEIFRREVFRMLQSKGLLTEERLQLLYSWRHSGFHVHIGAPLDPRRNRSALWGAWPATWCELRRYGDCGIP
jgi:hypothetical protein